MERPCCPSCGWGLRLRAVVYRDGTGDAVWVAVCPNRRRAKPCMHPVMWLDGVAVTVVQPERAIYVPSEAALLRRAPVAA